MQPPDPIRDTRRLPRWMIAEFYVLAVITLYVAAYLAIVEPLPSGIFQIGPGRFPKMAVYPIGSSQGFGKVREYSFDGFTQPFFAPINQLDRLLRPEVWNEK